MERIGSSDYDHDDFELVGQELKEIERPPLFALTTSQQMMDFVDEQQFSAKLLEKVNDAAFEGPDLISNLVGNPLGDSPSS